MGRDNAPKERRLNQLKRKQNQRASYDRILIISEGSKTEPLYFKEIRKEFRLHTANIEIHPSDMGTDPLSVVRYAKQIFEHGDRHKGILPRAFEHVFAVFDRDDHHSFFEALSLAQSLNRKLRNDNKQVVNFSAIASIPSFELWLLLHYEDIKHLLHRDEVIKRLKQYIQGYEKGLSGIFALTKDLIPTATKRAQQLKIESNVFNDKAPYTDIAQLVGLLMNLTFSNSM